jgi:hypothetical protein
LAKIRRAIDSSIFLRNKRDLILAFVDRVSVDSDVNEEWRRHVEARRDEELDHLITARGLTRCDAGVRRESVPERCDPHDGRGGDGDPPSDLALLGR